MKFIRYLETKIYNPLMGKNVEFELQGRFVKTIRLPYDVNRHPLFEKGTEVDLYLDEKPGSFIIYVHNKKYDYVEKITGYENRKEMREEGWDI